MRYPASEKLEVIRTVEGSHLPTKKTLDMLGIPRTTFYRWYDRYTEGGFDELSDGFEPVSVSRKQRYLPGTELTPLGESGGTVALEVLS